MNKTLNRKNFKMKRFAYAISGAIAVAALGCLAASSVALAQQEGIVILNQEGEELAAEEIQELVEDARAANMDEPAERGAIADIEEGSSIQIDNDRIIITGPDGEEREIDISGARSVSVSQSIKSVDNNGQQDTVRSGKAIIIDPDGERHVIPLGDVEGGAANVGALDELMLQGMPEDLGIIIGEGLGDNGLHMLGNLPAVWQSSGEGGGYIIGVGCEKVNDQLRAHLDLGEGVGVVVHSVSAGSPSAEAGVEIHDVLMYADDTELSTLEDLTGVVNIAGEESQSISITALRNGSEISFEITPVENAGDAAARGFMLEGARRDFMLQRIGPGIIVDGEFRGKGIGREFGERVEKEMEQMREQHRELMDQHLKMMEDLKQRGNFGRGILDFQRELKEDFQRNRNKAQDHDEQHSEQHSEDRDGDVDIDID